MRTQIFTVPVVIEISGWVAIRANSLEEAKQECARLNDEGVSISSVEDVEIFTEVMTDEMMPDGDLDYT